MNKTSLKTLAQYNSSSNATLLALVNSEAPSLLDKECGGSFKTIRSIILHAWDAEFIWQQRLAGLPIEFWPSESADSSTDLNDWVKCGNEFIKLIDGYSEESLNNKISYKNMKGVAFENSATEILQHVFNHSTFHRGQIVHALRNLGFSAEIPSTDFIAYLRK